VKHSSQIAVSNLYGYLAGHSKNRGKRSIRPDPVGARELFGIQMLRALAGLAVVTHHSLEQSNGALGRFSPDWLTTSGASGVDIFFVVSGFIMLHVSFGSRRASVPAPSFLYRRATRIYPLYWLCCMAMFAASLAGLLAHHHWGDRALLASLLLAPNSNPLIFVAWTLVYEIYFYLIFAATLPYQSIGVSVVGTNLAVIGFALSGFALPQGAVRDFLTNPIPLEFCMGLWLSWAFARQTERGKPWPIGFAPGVIGVALLALAAVVVHHRSTAGLDGFPRVLFWGVPSVLVVAAFLGLQKPQSAALRFAVLIGNASYALYLTHVFVMLAYAKLQKTTIIGRIDQRWVVPCVIVLAVAIAIATHLLLERPMLAGVRRITKRQPEYALSA
jgi:exopolysaccharide production protein ExoZ